MLPRLFIGGELDGKYIPMEKNQGTYSNPTVIGDFEYYHRQTLTTGQGSTEVVYVDSSVSTSHVSSLFREKKGI